MSLSKTVGAILISLVLTSFLLPNLLVYGQAYPLVIAGVRTLDISGNPVNSFTRGGTAVVEVTLRSTEHYTLTKSYLLIVEVFDPRGYVVYVGFVTDTITGGQTKTCGAGYNIPYNSQPGTYVAKVFCWNNWPSIAGPSWRSWAAPSQVTFNVT